MLRIKTKADAAVKAKADAANKAKADATAKAKADSCRIKPRLMPLQKQKPMRKHVNVPRKSQGVAQPNRAAEELQPKRLKPRKLPHQQNVILKIKSNVHGTSQVAHQVQKATARVTLSDSGRFSR